jgi:hypothetical protein
MNPSANLSILHPIIENIDACVEVILPCGAGCDAAMVSKFFYPSRILNIANDPMRFGHVV